MGNLKKKVVISTIFAGLIGKYGPKNNTLKVFSPRVPIKWWGGEGAKCFQNQFFKFGIVSYIFVVVEKAV